jgi:hypothetical protein
MKSFIARIFASMLVVIMGMAASAQAQTISTIKVSIPFEFSFGTKTFPAGNYALLQPSEHFLVLRDSEGNNVAEVPTQFVESFRPADGTKLKFYPSNGKYTLAEVWLRESYSGLELYKAKQQNFERARSVQVSLVHE